MDLGKYMNMFYVKWLVACPVSGKAAWCLNKTYVYINAWSCIVWWIYNIISQEPAVSIFMVSMKYCCVSNTTWHHITDNKVTICVVTAVRKLNLADGNNYFAELFTIFITWNFLVTAQAMVGMKTESSHLVSVYWHSAAAVKWLQKTQTSGGNLYNKLFI